MGDFLCGSSVAEGCAAADRNGGQGIEWGSEASFKNIVEQAVDMATIGVKLAAGLIGASLSDNLKRAINAGRCAINALGNNAWNLLAAAWYAAKQFNMHEMVNGYLDMGAEMICTCHKDVDGLMGMLAQYGMAPSEEETARFFGSCSEAAAALNA